MVRILALSKFEELLLQNKLISQNVQRDCRNYNSSYYFWPLSHGCFQSEKEVDLKKPVNVYQLVQLTQTSIS